MVLKGDLTAFADDVFYRGSSIDCIILSTKILRSWFSATFYGVQ